MEHTAVQRLARALRVIVIAALVLNLLCLLLVPGAVAYSLEDGPRALAQAILAEMDQWLGRGSETHFPMAAVFLAAWQAVWQTPLTAMWTVFLWLCGGCTAVILWQAKCVLDTILEGNPFQMRNAQALKRAAVCCWVVSGTALFRLVQWLIVEQNLVPLFTYTALFIPVFFTGGLLLLVMSALFRQAAELQEDQNLTI